MTRGKPGSALRPGPVPSAPTGRHVITAQGTGKNADQGSMQTVHWPPKPTHHGQEWECRACAAQFIYEEGSKTWRMIEA